MIGAKSQSRQPIAWLLYQQTKYNYNKVKIQKKHKHQLQITMQTKLNLMKLKPGLAAFYARKTDQPYSIAPGSTCMYVWG